jgi:hypothetical protein
MNSIQVRRTIESDMLHLPEVKPLIGKTVLITIRVDQAETASAVVPGTQDWDAFARIAKQLRETGYDFEAWRELREAELDDTDDRQP